MSDTLIFTEAFNDVGGLFCDHYHRFENEYQSENTEYYWNYWQVYFIHRYKFWFP